MTAAIALLITPFAAHAADGVKIDNAANVRTITAPGYKAVVSPEGFLTTISVNGQEFLAGSLDISKGLYMYKGAPVAFKTVTQVGDNEIDGEADAGSIKYVFSASAITITATTKTDTLPLYIVLQPDIAAVGDSAGAIQRTPAAKNWPTAVAYKGGAKLTFDGLTRQWGPWSGAEVFETSVTPASVKLTITAAKVTDAEVAKIAALPAGAPVAPAPAPAAAAPVVPAKLADVALISPLDYQVFQRSTKTQGTVRISGTVADPKATIQARFTGKPLEGTLPSTWVSVPVRAADRSFYSDVAVPAGGWYKLELKVAGNAPSTVAVEHVGVGEVFVGAGQSNSTNYGQGRSTQTTGMVSSFSGTAWQLADDPQLGAHDKSTGGSFWPAFGDDLYNRYHVPIGVAVTGHGGTSVNAWVPGGELFNWMLTRVGQLGPRGFRALLWHQGESDTSMTSDEYFNKLGNIITASKARAGWPFPWFVAQVSYHNPGAASFASTRDAQQRLWDEGFALKGPDTDTLGGDNRDNGGAGIHFSEKGRKAHGDMWAAIVGAYIDAQ
jgi:hypothetical protein